MEEIGCSSPAHMRRRDQLAAAGGLQSCCLQFGTGVSVALGSVAAQAPRGWRQREAGQRGRIEGRGGGTKGQLAAL